MPLNLWQQPATSLKGVGDKTTKKLAKLGIKTIGDLLLHCPYRYEDRTRLTPIQDVLPESWVLLQGMITEIEITKTRKKRCTLWLSDKTGIIALVFFHYTSGQLKTWEKGAILRCYGQAKVVRQGMNIVHPEYEFISEENSHLLPTHLTPIYPTVAGLAQGWLRKTVRQILNGYSQQYQQKTDLFANCLIHLQPMQHWIQALNTIHQPLPDVDQDSLISRQHPAYYRLIFEELFAHHISLKNVRSTAQNRQAMPFLIKDEKITSFYDELPFTLTAAQARVWQEIRHDLSKPVPMLRLVQGDVGCGKTVIAALTAYAALENQKQVAIMVPTEILAEQHYAYFKTLFEKLGYRCDLLIGQLKAKAKRSLLENLVLGLTQIIIGTHALFQENIQFKALGLVIIDEQHRFGVHQRLTLQNKGLTSLYAEHAHQLIMTATPIPRTLMMSHYSHLDISTIDSLPPNRQPISTLAISQSRREDVIARIAHVCASGQQVYWVCTLIDGSDLFECQAAEEAAKMLRQLLQQYNIGLIHGKMSASDKEQIMQAFYQGAINILVATTVIEVGVNVPNATLMVIENPERLGLAQLHQLRGRVGRGSQASFCVLLYQSPLSEMAQARLQIMRESSDGFVIAQKDLELRGPGEVLGTKQTGMVSFKVVDYQRDAVFIQKMSQLADKLSALSKQQVDSIVQRWCGQDDYANA